MCNGELWYSIAYTLLDVILWLFHFFVVGFLFLSTVVFFYERILNASSPHSQIQLISPCEGGRACIHRIQLITIGGRENSPPLSPLYALSVNCKTQSTWRDGSTAWSQKESSVNVCVRTTRRDPHHTLFIYMPSTERAFFYYLLLTPTNEAVYIRREKPHRPFIYIWEIRERMQFAVKKVLRRIYA